MMVIREHYALWEDVVQDQKHDEDSDNFEFESKLIEIEDYYNDTIVPEMIV